MLYNGVWQQSARHYYDKHEQSQKLSGSVGDKCMFILDTHVHDFISSLIYLNCLLRQISQMSSFAGLIKEFLKSEIFQDSII